MFEYTVCMLVHLTHLVLLSAILSNEIFCVHFSPEIRFFCVPTTLAKQILFHNHTHRKVVVGIYNVLVHYVNACAPDSSGAVLFNHFI